MPPGNNSGKPAPKGPCTYCRKETCNGNNCVFTGFEVVGGNSSSSQRRNEYSSVNPNAMERIKVSARPSSDIGTVLSTTKVSQPGSAHQQSNVAFTRRSTVSPVTAFPATTSTSHLESTVLSTTKVSQPGSAHQQSNVVFTRRSTVSPVTAFPATTSTSHLESTVLSTTKVSQPGSAHQQSNVVFTRRSTVSPVTAFPATTSTSHLENDVQQKNVNSNEAKVSDTAPQNKPFQFSSTSHTSKPGQEAGAYKSNLDLENSVVKPVEPITVFKFNSTIQPISSTEFVKSNPSVLPDLTAPSKPLIPKTQELPESKEIAMKCSLLSFTDCEVDKSNLELIKTDTKRPQNADVSKKDGIKPPINKSSRCASIISKSSCNSDVVEKKSEKQLKLHHSSKASKYEGVVYQILGPRNAKVKVAERNGMPLKKSEWGSADAVHKYALLLVDKIQDDEHGSLYSANIPINLVLSKGDIIYLICTAHNKPSIEFQLFAHQAWKTGRKTRSNNDDDSVASYGSQTGSEAQESSSSKTKKTSSKNKKEELNQDSYDVSNVVKQWLDTNEYSQNRNENSKALKLLAGCHYIGKVIEVRLPRVFIVEISSNDGNQCILVYTNHFHPEGINSPVMACGVSLESFVNIGDEIVVIPIKNTAMQENKFEWVASKAWPKNIQSNVSKLVAQTDRQKEQGGTVMKKVDQEESLTYFKGLAPSVKHWKEFNGVILSLQYDWGLVTEIGGKQSAYVFTRENAYLFGMCLQHFFLDDVLKEGQLVKFSLDNGDIGAMNALAVWFGNQFPDFNLFDIAASKYCEERKIKFSIEDLLTQHGKSMYLEQ